MMIRGYVIALCLSLFSGVSIAQAVPAIEEAKLDNGVRVLLMEAHNVPMLAMKLVMPAGSRFDAPEKAGTASLLAGMLSDHTAKHDFTAWADLLDADAIHLGASAGRDDFNVSLTVLKDALEPGLDAFAELLLQPGWNQKRFAIMKQDSIASAQKEKEEPGAQASQAGVDLLFAGHPYGHRPGGSMQTLARIEMTDLKQLYRTQIKPEGAVLAVSGDITMRELLPLLNARLSSWKGKATKGLHDIDSPKVVAGQERDVTLPTTQMLVQLLRLGPSRSDADFFPAFVLNHVLGGGGFGSRLMEEVREKRGLVYGVYSYFMPLAVEGPFVITLQTRADQAGEAEQVVRDVIASMAAGKISAKQLKASKENLIGSFAQRMDSNRERVGLIAMIGLYGLPLNYLSAWTEQVERVSLQQVKAQAERYLKPEQWNRVRVGPASAFQAVAPAAH
ncbi:pitrilysin family protein [Mariprofundus sp. EBB-1]|uniref:M16 family metallopeptidase n=1 Tax=Mariprofundus sp. EBB-1 TaxID=2650971 RepID=UPI001F3BC680|nr:pitrilysin family protein [Mariprofundus sp. EBB-1]